MRNLCHIERLEALLANCDNNLIVFKVEDEKQNILKLSLCESVLADLTYQTKDIHNYIFFKL